MKKWLKNLVIFGLILAYFFGIQGTTHFADPDCFYNTRMALIMKENLVLDNFPWLQYSVLKDNYIDHHFLYHVFLIPWVSLEKMGISPLLGVRLSAIFLASCLIFLFYIILKKWRIRYALFFVGLLLISTFFIFRISLARAPAISGIFLLGATYFILQDKKKFNWFLFIICFGYVWLYSAWLLVPVILFFYILGGTLNEIVKIKGLKLRLKRFWSRLWQNVAESKYKIGAVLGGIGTGLIINPYFPANLKFYYHQIFQIAIVNFHSKFGVGAEWYPLEPMELYRNSFVFIILLIISVALWLVVKNKQDKKTWALFLLSVFFFLYTLKARRSIEYLVPFGVLFIVTVYDNIFEKKPWRQLEKEFNKFFSLAQRRVLIGLVSLLVFVAPYFIYSDLSVLSRWIGHFRFNHLLGASEWVKQNVPVGETVFNTNWDYFGFLFYHNPDNYYITGLDQTFMYSYDPELLELYVDISKGLYAFDLKETLRDKFGSNYVLISEARNKEFYKVLTSLKEDFDLVYEDEELSIFALNGD